MRYIDLFVRDHPEMDVQRAIEQNCPNDFGYQDSGECYVLGGADSCRACWEREAEETSGPPWASAPTEEAEA